MNGKADPLPPVSRTLVTAGDGLSRPVTTAIPHAELLARIAANLLEWQATVARLGQEMTNLCALGICLDDAGMPVIPTWWQRQDRPYRYLVWPAAYARRRGQPRRQYVRPAEQAAWEARRQRTLAYANAQARRQRLTALIEKTGQELARLADQAGW